MAFTCAARSSKGHIPLHSSCFLSLSDAFKSFLKDTLSSVSICYLQEGESSPSCSTSPGPRVCRTPTLVFHVPVHMAAFFTLAAAQGRGTNSIPIGRLARMRFKLVKCPTQGYPTGEEHSAGCKPHTCPAVECVAWAQPDPVPATPRSPLAAFCSSVFLGVLFPLPRLLSAPSRAPRSRQEPHRAMWLWARVSTEQGQSEGLL